MFDTEELSEMVECSQDAQNASSRRYESHYPTTNAILCNFFANRSFHLVRCIIRGVHDVMVMCLYGDNKTDRRLRNPVPTSNYNGLVLMSIPSFLTCCTCEK